MRLPSRFILYIKESIGLIIPVSKNEEGSGVDWANFPRSTGFNFLKNGEGNGVDWSNSPSIISSLLFNRVIAVVIGHVHIAIAFKF